MENNRFVVDSFMFYIFNKWCKTEAIAIFGVNLGSHVFGKWVECREDGRDQLEWYASLDEDCRTKLVERAVECYSKK